MAQRSKPTRHGLGRRVRTMSDLYRAVLVALWRVVPGSFQRPAALACLPSWSRVEAPRDCVTAARRGIAVPLEYGRASPARDDVRVQEKFANGVHVGWTQHT